jgi:hypothetical protein
MHIRSAVVGELYHHHHHIIAGGIKLGVCVLCVCVVCVYVCACASSATLVLLATVQSGLSIALMLLLEKTDLVVARHKQCRHHLQNSCTGRCCCPCHYWFAAEGWPARPHSVVERDSADRVRAVGAQRRKTEPDLRTAWENQQGQQRPTAWKIPCRRRPGAVVGLVGSDEEIDCQTSSESGKNLRDERRDKRRPTRIHQCGQSMNKSFACTVLGGR